jgi:hypothetical protein
MRLFIAKLGVVVLSVVFLSDIYIECHILALFWVSLC